MGRDLVKEGSTASSKERTRKQLLCAGSTAVWMQRGACERLPKGFLPAGEQRRVGASTTGKGDAARHSLAIT